MLYRLLLVVLLGAAVYSEKVRYDNYQVFRVVPNTEEQVRFLYKLQNSASGFNFWNNVRHVNNPIDIMVPPHKLPEFEEIMESLQVNYNLIIRNVQSLMDSERRSGTPRDDFGWTDYYPLDKVNAWLDSLVEKYPSIVSSIIGGSSFEGRQIRGVKVSYKAGNPGVFIESGIHANEWINVATVTFILNELLTSNDTHIRNIAENFDWYIFPSVNPDGYEYTHTKDRNWRKNRRPGTICTGTDPNRNWDYYWLDEGASSDQCSESYAGSSAFSEVETRSLSEYLTSLVSKLQVYLCFHSYSQLLMIPYGLTHEVADNYDALVKLGNKSIQALARRYGTQYKFGTIHDIIYPASGSSIDWVKKNLKIPYTFVWELRDTGEYGMLLPADQIIPTGQETLDSVISILEDVQDLEKTKMTG
ncbi:zinc carboxypeptidase [Anabrus simplex]|uniref:zinc carboxypeptidase n=1 Tax=Anabrus simplex TaxID=316456 RepID=UPI0035A30A9E